MFEWKRQFYVYATEIEILQQTNWNSEKKNTETENKEKIKE